MKILNLYAGIGGNRKLWGSGHQITAIEHDPKIAKIYSDFFPKDKIIVGDAHQYLLENYTQFDFIWSSPPCQSHTKMIRSGRNRSPRYPDMRLYEEILFLSCNFRGKWIVENVVPYYTPLIKAKKIGRHLFWSNFEFTCKEVSPPKNFINLGDVEGSNILKKWLGLEYPGNIYYEKNHDPSQILRNCVHPEVGRTILESL